MNTIVDLNIKMQKVSAQLKNEIDTYLCDTDSKTYNENILISRIKGEAGALIIMQAYGNSFENNSFKDSILEIKELSKKLDFNPLFDALNTEVLNPKQILIQLNVFIRLEGFQHKYLQSICDLTHEYRVLQYELSKLER